jgi:hypothetical protein
MRRAQVCNVNRAWAGPWANLFSQLFLINQRRAVLLTHRKSKSYSANKFTLGLAQTNIQPLMFDQKYPTHCVCLCLP